MRFIVILLGLALYGLYALMSDVGAQFEGKSTGNSPSAQVSTPPTGTSNTAESPLGMVGSMVSGITGVKAFAIPATGCSTSALPPEKVLELLNTVPEAQRGAVAKLLDSSSTVWSAQAYTGPEGMGFCLPTKDLVVVLPHTTATRP